MASRRLGKELKNLQNGPVSNCTIAVSEHDMYLWQLSMTGPKDSLYEGGNFQVKIEFPTEYPFKAPVFTFETKIYHPSVEMKTGKICADLLAENWGPTLNVKHCLEILQGMLKAPDADHPLEESIAKMLREDPKGFEKKARQYTKEFAV
eukprot:CAMPEP_0194145278 /NCGR_PEP_ID=MMETSP0152-20130528/16173_1 /TAXON_ID=1049557 /ORGANISM="Thalassiothrix antarctica, Strain L6-D1" /LENGTH=148 /DNA_ID=CAMNT_0038845421 /DNA_START=58 /DNA_END=504 /DNA_ORIENTATION=+